MKKVILAIVCLVMMVVVSGCGATPKLDLSEMVGLNKQQVTEKVGKPSAVLQDNQAEFQYNYDTGMSILGNDNHVTTITLDKTMLTKSLSDSYKLSGVALDSSFDENVKRLGVPDALISRGNKRMSIYLKDNNNLLLLISGVNNDNVSAVSIVPYEYLRSMMTLDADGFLESDLSDITDMITIENKTPTASDNALIGASSNLTIAIDGNKSIYSIQLTGKSIYNIFQLRIGDSASVVYNKLSSPKSSKELPSLNERQLSFINDVRDKEIVININKTDNKITKIDYHLLK